MFDKIGRLDMIYNDFIQSEEYNNITTLEAETKSRRELDGLLKDIVTERKDYAPLSDAICTFATSREQAGFEMGFRYAFQMCIELFARGREQ